MNRHEIGKVELAGCRSDEQWTPLGEAGDVFSCYVVVVQKSSAVQVAFEGVGEQFLVDFTLVSFDPKKVLIFNEQADPGIEVGRAVVAMCHRNRRAVWSSDYVDYVMGTFQVLFQNYH